MNRSVGVASLILSLLCVAVSPAWSQERADKLHYLTDRIVERELDLMRLNTFFRLRTNYQTRGRTIRQFLYNLAASGVSLGATTSILALRMSKNRPDPNGLKAGAIGLVTGQAIVQSGIAIESTLDRIRDRRSREHGLDPRTLRKEMHDLKDEIDALISEREKLVDSLPSTAPGRNVIAAETAVLEDVRNLGLLEFARFYSDQHKRWISRNVSYINGLVATGAGGYGGSLIGLLSITSSKPKMLVPAGVGFIVSSATVMASPLINRFFSRWSKRRSSKQIKEALGLLTEDSIETMSSNLGKLTVECRKCPVSERPNHIMDRMAVYAAELEMMRQEQIREADLRQRGERLFRDRLLTNNAIAGAKMTWGTLLIAAGASDSSRPSFNNTLAAAATVYTCGQSIWVGDTLFSGRRPRSLKFPVGGQLILHVEKLEKRMDRLKQLESLVKESRD